MAIVHQSATIQDLIPLLFVEDMDGSLAFYRDQLGFDVAEKWEPEGKIAWCRLVRGGATLMLQEACEEDGPAAGRGRGVGFFFHCDDADTVHIELCAKGLLLDPPTTAFYGMKQLFFKDPDGYELCFQSRVKP
jgi:uncharacterized glyoxalase superfamily protein PhnB